MLFHLLQTNLKYIISNYTKVIKISLKYKLNYQQTLQQNLIIQNRMTYEILMNRLLHVRAKNSKKSSI